MSDREKKEVDAYKKTSRKSEHFVEQMKILIQSSENREQLDVITSSFLMQEIDSEDTLGKLLLGPKIVKWIIKFGLLFVFLWLIGTTFALLAINKVIGDEFAIASTILCFPATLNFFKLNISILKMLIFQFETILMTISILIFCLCGALLLREREYNWSYFIFFLSLWINGLFLNFADAVGTSIIRNMLIFIKNIF